MKPGTERVAHWLMAAIFGLAPLLVVPAAADSYMLPKWTLIGVGAALLAGAAVALAFGRVPLRIGLHPANGILVGMLAWMGLSVSWAQSPSLAWTELGRFGSVVAVVLLAQSVIGGRRDLLMMVLKSLLGATLVLAVWAVAVDAIGAFAPERIGVVRRLGDWRDVVSTAGLGNTSHVGDFLAAGFLGWMAVFVLARRRGTRALAMGSLWLHAAGLIVAWSVHSNASLIVASLVMVGALRGERALFAWRRRLRGWGALFCGFAVVVAFYVVDHPANPHGSAVWGGGDPEARGGIFAQAFSSQRWKDGWPTRQAIWLNSLEIVRQNAWVGVGAGNFTYAYPAALSGAVLANPTLAPYAGSWTNAAHNDVIQVWSELGVPGLFLLVALGGVAVRGYWRRARSEDTPGNRVIMAAGLAALVGMSLQAQMNFPLEMPASLLLFGLLVTMPDTLAPRGRAAGENLLVTIDRHVGPLRVRLGVENMQVPREIGVRLPLEGGARIAAASVAVLLSVALAWPLAQPLRADVAYREAREAKRELDARIAAGELGGAGTGLSATIEESSATVLRIWPAHVDCRSGLSDLYLIGGRWEDALRESRVVLERLNAIEVHLRIAVAAERLGRMSEADDAWRVVFGRRPEIGRQYPDAFRRWQHSGMGAVGRPH